MINKAQEHLRNGYKNPDRLAAIHNSPCALSYKLGIRQKTVTQAHHKIGLGLGLKASDNLTMALSQEFHQTGQHAIHHIGTKAFERKFNTTQDELIEITNKLLEKYC
jgi:hypothetical protein